MIHLTLTEFIEKLSNRYGKPKNDYVVFDIRNYFENRPANYNELYDSIAQNYEYQTFPGLAKILQYYSMPSGQKGDALDLIRQHNEKIKQTWMLWPVKKIIQKTMELRKTCDQSATATEFLHLFNQLWSDYCFMKDKGLQGEEMKCHLEYVLKNLKEGKQVEPIYTSQPPVKNLEKVFIEKIPEKGEKNINLLDFKWE